MRIRRLPEEVANQIAAGEVIERPASVVKELLENALDAKADSIQIEIGYGGLNEIRIIDNGQGIYRDDLPLAIAAHATSKINALDDLHSITSMGFRGEALASIASVSRIVITSKPADQDLGMMLTLKGQELECTPVARAQGTTIEVKDIFYNAPVRKKFLKSEKTEFQAIDAIVRRFALSEPTIAIELSHNGKLQLQLNKALDARAQVARVTKVLGKAFSDSALAIDQQQAGMQLQGWISGVDYQRSQNDKLWIYLNGRMVRDKLLNHALKQAYESKLHPGRSPACLLYLTMDPRLVDVNVHPTKHEVRFQQPRLVHDFICETLVQRLNEQDLPLVETMPAYWKDLQVAESHQPPTYKAHHISATRQTPFDIYHDPQSLPSPSPKSHWVQMNAQFALWISQKESYALPFVIDVFALECAYRHHCLQQIAFPLPSRPLLVPIRLRLEVKYHSMDEFKAALLQVGIVVQLQHNETYQIQSLAIATPHLNIKDFVQACCERKSLNHCDLLEELVQHQARNLQLQDYQDFLENIMADSQTTQPFIKAFTEQYCQDFIYGE